MRGVKAMTATSGPGWALMTETVQYALMTETPVVIAVVQRLGPSTGGATQGAQGDVLFVEYCTSGGYTLPVLCPSTPAECYELTLLAFSWAELLRMPVILLTDKEVGMTMETVDYAHFAKLHAIDRKLFPAPFHGSNGAAAAYAFGHRAEVPVFAPVGGAAKVVATGSAHNKRGELKKNDAETLEVLLHLEEKVRYRKNGLTLVRRDLQPKARTLVISYGITSRAVRTAVRTLRRQGTRVSALQVLTMFPVPEKQIAQAVKDVERIVVAEENLSGLYAGVLAPLFGAKELVRLTKVGSMITPEEICEAVV